MHGEKDELRKRIEGVPQLKKDFDFFIEKTRLLPHQLITGLWLDCNLMHADRQTLHRNEKKELWPISEDTLLRNIKNISRMARQIHAINQTKDLSPTLNHKVGENFVELPETLRLYALELERRVNLRAVYWERKRSRIPSVVDLTRENSLYERIRSTGGYYQTRLCRLVNVAREIRGYSRISQRAFKIWLNRFEKRRKKRNN
jgi:hypothetical protein